MFWTVTQSLLEGTAAAAELFFLTLIFALPLGLIVSFGSMSKWAPFARVKANVPAWLRALRPVSLVVRTIVWVFRGTPLMLQLLIIYYGPGLLWDNNVWGSGTGGRMFAAAVAFILNYACYFSEIYRGGIESVPRGQYEAGLVLGMTRRQIFFRVTLLQMIKRIVPPMSNEIITLVKDTSLARIIAVTEIIKVGENFMRKGMIWPLFYTGVFYLVFVGALTLLFGWIEKKLDYFK